jgi:hypothetical protein
VRARKVDGNYKDVIAEFERLGCRVHRTNADWDLTVKYADYVRCIEVKNPNTAYGKKGLSERQKDLVITPYLVRSLEDVRACVESMKRYCVYINDGIRRELEKGEYIASSPRTNGNRS